MPEPYVLPDSDEILELISEKGYALYDITQYTDEPPTWDKLQSQGPTDKVRSENSYIWAPIPKAGESLRDAYIPTRGVGPALKFTTKDELESTEWLEIVQILISDLVVFSRLEISSGYARLGHPTMDVDMDEAYCEVGNLLKLLKRHLTVLSLEAFNAAAERSYYETSLAGSLKLMFIVVDLS